MANPAQLNAQLTFFLHNLFRKSCTISTFFHILLLARIQRQLKNLRFLGSGTEVSNYCFKKDLSDECLGANPLISFNKFTPKTVETILGGLKYIL